MFPGEIARLQVKKEADECAIDMPAFAEMPPENFVPQYPGPSDSRRGGTAAQRAPEPRHERAAAQDVNRDGGARPIFVAQVKGAGKCIWRSLNCWLLRRGGSAG